MAALPFCTTAHVRARTVTMPELPEVEAFRRIAMGVLDGERIVSVWADDDPLVIEGVSSKTLLIHRTFSIKSKAYLFLKCSSI